MSILNNLNRTLNTVNRTGMNVRQTQRNVRGFTGGNNRQNNRQKEQKNDVQNWTCTCGNENTSKFCGECGGSPPVCSNKKCGIIVNSKFCSECGSPAS